jgi:hypothetical protein
MFKQLKTQVQASFVNLQSDTLFQVNVDRDKIYNLYLDGFTDELRQEHNCNCCKSFLRQFGGVVGIKDNKIVSIWDNLAPPDEYKQSVENLRNYIHSLPVDSIFLHNENFGGTDKNLSNKGITWEHFYTKFNRNFVSGNIGTVTGTATANKNTLKRALEELTTDSVETVLELIDQDSLYRGQEFKAILTNFLNLKNQYSKVAEEEKDNFCWSKSLESVVVSKIRNSAVGTLLIDLSDGMELDNAVTRFEKVMAPTNYKRPTALVTPKMVEKAKETLSELGLLDSLDRRYASPTDISVENLLFVDKSSQMNDVFGEVSKDTKVDIKKLEKVEEVSIEDFINKIVPKAKSIEVLVENKHLPNFTSLITSDSDSDTLFKWDNKFSWSYTGGITDSIKEKVKAAGGNVDGVLRASLSWSNHDDLDLHCLEPKGNEIYFGRKMSESSGTLDVDMNAGWGISKTPVENIIWTNSNRMKEGIYKVLVHNYNQRVMIDQGYHLQIECNGEVFDFESDVNPKQQTYGISVTFTWNRKDGIKFHDNVKSKTQSREKWGVKTNTFVKVKQSMLSPNYWNNKVGNKHYMFVLENCVSDETPRPFFNEFLKEELNPHRKVLEILGAKVKIEQTPNQLSGLGFSETQKNSFIARVDGKFKRCLKVNI